MKFQLRNTQNDLLLYEAIQETSAIYLLDIVYRTKLYKCN